MKNRLLKDLSKLRSKDKYNSKELENELKNKLFPGEINDLILSLSNVTGAFYGLAMKSIGDQLGYQHVNQISEKLFYQLGVIKTQQCLKDFNPLPKDTRSIAIVLISAIYNASPEYHFELKKYQPNHTIIKLTGEDRYLRILNQLNISKYVNFPTLIPFLQGIQNTLGIDCKIEHNFKIIDNSSEAECTYEFISNN